MMNNKTFHVQLYTDGACRGNPGPGGWAAILQHGDYEKVLSGKEVHTTNNRMELTAVIEGLSALKFPCDVSVYTDSKYVADAINQRWLYSWKQNGWKKANRDPVLNVDLWQRLLPLLGMHNATFIWIKGHDGHPMNERADAIAVKMIDKIKERE